MFQRAADAKFRLRLLSNSKEVIAVCSHPLAAPHTGSWDPQRFVIPAAPLADRAILQRQRLSPAAAMGTVHRKTNESFRLFGLFPAFLTPEVRHTSKESSRERARFTQEVVYHLQIPLRSSLATQVTEVNAQLFE